MPVKNFIQVIHIYVVKDFKVLKGITFNENLAKEHILEIQEIAKIDGEFVEFQTKILSKTPKGKTHYHFSAQIKLVRKYARSSHL